ncbi:hypothetical protein VWX96_17080 [Phaeobacter sp. A90a-4f]|uniref:hypothetical protein n=1 Tax=unclassified Phaeobacter TaxID=2621772 RepID=UPI003A846DD2
MSKLVLNLGYGVQFEGEYHPNGHPKNICKVTGSADPAVFGRNVDVMRQLVELWNSREAEPDPCILNAISFLKSKGFDVFEAVPPLAEMDDATLRMWRTKINAWGTDIHHRQTALVQQICDEIDRRDVTV